jgi:putative endonuclease
LAGEAVLRYNEGSSLTQNGPVAQLGARLNGIQEVTGSIPVRSTNLRSPASMSELRLASHPSRFRSRVGRPTTERFTRPAEVARRSAEGAEEGWQATAPPTAHLRKNAIYRRRRGRTNYSCPGHTPKLRKDSGSPRRTAICTQPRMQPKRIVYILRSASTQGCPYVGLTSNVRARLADHNAGRCPHTARYRPWQLHVTIELPDEQRAVDFERYLKSGSGRAFAKRHFG